MKKATIFIKTGGRESHSHDILINAVTASSDGGELSTIYPKFVQGHYYTMLGASTFYKILCDRITA